MNTPSQVRFVGPLAPYIAGWQEELEGHGYRPSSVASHVRLVAQISEWLEAQELCVADLTPDRIEAFFALRRQRARFRQTSSHSLSGFVRHLQGQGVLPIPAPVVADGLGRLLRDYRQYLLNERGLVEKAAQRYVQIGREFLKNYVRQDELDVAGIRADAVTQFLRAECSIRKSSTAKSLAVGLRSLLRFLYLEGFIDKPLAQAVPTPGGPSSSGLPKALKAEEWTGLLSSCQRTSAVGRRDYAIVLVLGRLGLRAGEVAGLALEDVCWRVGALRVRGKGGRVDMLPLPDDVGKALAAYVRNGRPRVSTGALFRQALAPHGPLCATSVTGIVYRACGRAGLAPVGAHRLRHTAATQMLRAGASLNDIAQVLRHAHVETTALYAKVDRARLVDLARHWPGSRS